MTEAGAKVDGGSMVPPMRGQEETMTQLFPCPGCGVEPIFLPHLRCQTCICVQRDAAINRAEAAEASLAALRSQVQQIAQEMREATGLPFAPNRVGGSLVRKWADTLAALTTTGET